LLPLVGLTSPETPNPRSWGFFVLMSCVVALGASVIGAALWNMASRRLPITLSGQLIVSETLFALLYGFLHAHRWPRPLEWAAVFLLIGGVCWAVKKHAANASLSHNTLIDGDTR
jgi:drug/metabolite transporter (DMT)-like permease